jgi:hypothetical protein
VEKHPEVDDSDTEAIAQTPVWSALRQSEVQQGRRQVWVTPVTLLVEDTDATKPCLLVNGMSRHTTSCEERINPERGCEH